MTKNNTKFDEEYTKNSVSGHCSSLNFPSYARFETEPGPAFDAELNGLQSDARVFLEVFFSAGHLIEILKNGRNRKRRSARVFWSFRPYFEMH